VPALTVEAAHEHDFPDDPADILDGLVRDIAFVIQPGQMRFVRRLPASREADFPRRDQRMTKPPQPGNTVVSDQDQRPIRPTAEIRHPIKRDREGRHLTAETASPIAAMASRGSASVIADAAQCDVNTALGAANPSTCAYRAATTEAAELPGRSPRPDGLRKTWHSAVAVVFRCIEAVARART